MKKDALKRNDILLGRSSHPDRNMDINGLVQKTLQIDHKNIVYLDRKNITPNPENEKRFPQTDIEELRDWICLRKQLYQNLTVIPLDGTTQYMLIDGERRYRAISLLDDTQYSEIFPFGINCNVLPPSTDNTLLKLDSTLANYLQRQTNVFLRRQEVLDLYECLSDLKSRNMIDYDILDHMTNILGIKQRQLKNYIDTAHLIPEFEKKLQEGIITLREAIQISSFDSDVQQYLNKKHTEDGHFSSDDFTKARVDDNVRKSEKRLADLSSDLDKQKELYLSESNKLEELAHKSQNQEQIRRQEKRTEKARKKLTETETRYHVAKKALCEEKSPGHITKSNYDAEKLLSSINMNLKQIEKNPRPVFENDNLILFLKDINDRFTILTKNCTTTLDN